MLRKDRPLVWIVVGAMFLLGTAETLIRFITDYMWFSELNYATAFLKRPMTYIAMGGPVFIVSSLIFFFYLKALRTRYLKIAVTPESKDQKDKITKFIRWGAMALGVLYAYVFVSGLWFDWLGFLNRTPFGEVDPIFGMDVSFYFFVLPLMKELLGMGLALLFILGALTVGFMVILSNLRLRTSSDRVYDLNEFRAKHDLRTIFNRSIFADAIVKIGILGFIAFILIAFTNVISVYDLVYSPRGAAFGASYTDMNVSLKGYWLLAAVSLVGAVLFLYGALKKKRRLMIIGPAALIAVSLSISIAEVGVQKLFVDPDERAKERPYIVNNIAATQKAFQLDAIETVDFPAEKGLTAEALKDNQDIIKNIRINDITPLKITVNQLQGIRLYYEFNDVDVDRYTIDGEYRQVFIAAREMNQEKLEQQTWVNSHLQFTHGYGVALAPVNEVTPEGQPVLMVKDIPPISSAASISLTRPEIYFGEYTDNYIIVNGKEKEFDYPKGSDNVYANYEGSAGIKLGLLNRLLFSAREKNINPVISSALTSDSRIIINRNVLKRAESIMPWLSYDKDPYIVINEEDGGLYWIIDAYTAGNRYPCSQPHSSGINYVRNSVKVTINAYSGETNYYLYDPEDPVAETYSKIFPGLFKKAEEMPAGLASHIRYPKGLLDVQASMFRKFHVTNPDVFYNGEDIWEVAQEKYMQEQAAVEASYVMFRLPGEKQVEFVLNVPFTPKDKSNINALLMARNDGVHYGKLFMYRFPKDRLVQGPQMVESRIDQDTAISQQLTFWDQKGSVVLRGNMMPIPINNSLLYVEPIYLKSSGDRSLPEMKRVVVSYEEKVVMEETLAKALERIFGSEPDAVKPSDETAPAEGAASGTLSEAQALIEQAKGLIDSSVSGIEQLKTVLDQLTRLVNQSENQAPSVEAPSLEPSLKE